MVDPVHHHSNERQTLDLVALEKYLTLHIPTIRGPLSVGRLSGGQSNPTYQLDCPAGRFVLRRKPPGTLLPTAHAIDREYRVMAALGETDFPVPRMRHYCSDSTVIGTEFYVMDHVAGRVLFDTGLPNLTPTERRKTYEALIDTLARLHSVDADTIGLGDFGRSGGYITRQTKRWAAQYRTSATAEIPAMERLIDWLPAAVAAIPDETCLVHGDYRLDNVMLHPDRPEPVAVLDWELSTLGHPLADLSYFLMTWVFPTNLRYGMADLNLAGLGVPSLSELAERYARATGRGDLPDLDILLAYNIFRIAAILQGVYARGLDGTASSTDALSKGADVPRLAEIGWRYAQRADPGHG
ncbi:MAG: phosphotransferase family protein [Pseudomonadota bacterium]